MSGREMPTSTASKHRPKAKRSTGFIAAVITGATGKGFWKGKRNNIRSRNENILSDRAVFDLVWKQNEKRI
jgi:hypothetical protein